MGVESWQAGRSSVHRAEEFSPTGDFPASGGSARAGHQPVRRRNPAAPLSDFDGGPTGAYRVGRPTAEADRATTSRPGPGSARHRERRPSSRRPGGGPLGDRRGLTPAGALVLLLALGALGAILDRVLGHELWVCFSVAFVAAVLLTSARIHLEDLAASVVLVPIAYGAVAFVTSLVAQLGSSSPLKQHLVSAAGVMVLSAPVLVVSVLVAAVIALGRARAVTVARRRARNRAIRRYGTLPAGSRPRARQR
jgi:hypothetical protein